MVYRDPQTGKFVSDDDSRSWRDQKRISGIVNYTIPAADLGGGQINPNVSGDESEILDFTGFLENDEIYQIRHLEVHSVLALPTTATAEGNALIGYQIAPDSDSSQMMNMSPTFYGGGLSHEDDIIDVNSGVMEQGGVLHIGQLYAEAGHSDTVNALAGGAAPAHLHEQLHFGDNGPAYDRDDELYAPMEIMVDNVSDHAVVASVWVLAHGHVEELD